MLGRSLRGSRFLVVGPGRIGLATGRLASALGADVWFARRGEALLPLLATADVISLHVPLTPETRHLIDARAIAAMRGATALVNTARGAILDEEALAAALVEHRIAGAALDVFEDEPHVPKALLGLDNVVLTPHIGSGTRETRIRMGMLAVSALGDMLLRNRCPANAVD
jgi:glyoxylate reductase